MSPRSRARASPPPPRRRPQPRPLRKVSSAVVHVRAPFPPALQAGEKKNSAISELQKEIVAAGGRERDGGSKAWGRIADIIRRRLTEPRYVPCRNEPRLNERSPQSEVIFLQKALIYRRQRGMSLVGLDLSADNVPGK